MQRAEAEGRTVPDEELRQIVTRTVFEGVLTGYEISTESNEQRAQGGRDENGVNGVKRSRTDDGSG
ncbi:hypothetical protein A0H81_07796 [Grifola frondosa]|uniref:Uncharacterized protein n=1 Tax=Grifola frondosa TaxID=5627 RepID=A0A1C7M5H5_GRIFR|nr:hypothetical protein A0H81_07796 [Grifola frondosa]